MELKRINNKIIVRMNKGEEVMATLGDICEKENIACASVSAIGATNYVEVGFFDTTEKKYYPNTFTGDMEITSLVGNVTTKDDKPYIHLHINVADHSQDLHGGHLSLCVISATLEMIIDVIEVKVERQYDDECGLNLMKFDS